MPRNVKAEVLLQAYKSFVGQNPTIVECGCMRYDHEVPSDGASTLWFARWAKQAGGFVYSFDTDPEAVSTCRKVLVAEELMDKVSLQEIDGSKGISQIDMPIDVLYLDSSGDPRDTYDQLVSALPHLRMTSVIVIDDLHDHLAGKHWGKGELAVPLLRSHGWSSYETSTFGGGRIGMFFHEEGEGNA